MTKQEELIKIIRKYGTCIRPYSSKREPGLFTAICPGCRAEFRSTDPDTLKEMEYTITKRGDAVFFHRACMKKAWNAKII